MKIKSRIKQRSNGRNWQRFWETEEGWYQVWSVRVHVHNVPNYRTVRRNRKLIVATHTLVLTEKGKQENLERMLDGRDLMDVQRTYTANIM